ncbi:MAG: type II secretion system F family protein [Acidimicrobiales bacterium]
MASFKYIALGPDGRRVRGKADGYSLAAVTADLLDRGLQQVQVKERRTLTNVDVTPKKIKPVALMHLSRQLASFVRAGVPLIEALQVVQDDLTDKTLKGVVAGISEALRRGETLGDAASQYAKAFPPFYLGVLRSAELTGHLDDVLEQLSQYLERDIEAKRKIRSALAYPSLVMVMSLITVAVMAGFVLPRFKTFFEEFDAKLPLATRMLLAVTDFITAWGIFLAVGFLLFIVTVGVSQFTRAGKKAKDIVLLKIPLIRDVVKFAVIERFCRLLGSMVQAGIPMPEAMTIASEGSHNIVYEEKLTEVRDAMVQGEGIAEPISRTEMFPSSAVQMIRVGEETGTLETQLDMTARFFETELAYKIKNLTTMFEPMATLFMGFIVGFVAIALVSAIYGIYNQVDL